MDGAEQLLHGEEIKEETLSYLQWLELLLLLFFMMMSIENARPTLYEKADANCLFPPLRPHRDRAAPNWMSPEKHIRGGSAQE